MVANPKQELHDLVDRLSDEDLAEALAYVRWLISDATPHDPLTAVPIDDEPDTEDERAAVGRALEQLKTGEVIPHAQVRRELGL